MRGVSNPSLARPTNRAAKPGVHRSGNGSLFRPAARRRPAAPTSGYLRESLVSGLDSDASYSAADVIQLRVGEESAHDLRASPEPFKGRNGDGLQIIPGHRHSPCYLVVLDILVHPFIGVQLG